MITPFQKLLGVGAAPEPKAKIRVLRNLIIADDDGMQRHVDQGQELEVSRRVLRLLELSDYDLISSGLSKPVDFVDPTPPPDTARALPARWRELPESFSTWWNLTESFRIAREHLDAIRETRLQLYGTEIPLEKLEAGKTILMGRMTAQNPTHGKTGNWISSLRPIDLEDPGIVAQSRSLTRAEAAAENHLDRLRRDQSLNLQKAFLDCGSHRLGVADELQAVVDELGRIGFELFSVRTSALGLSEFQLRRLFHGSADYLKYCDHAAAINSGTSSAGLDPAGRMIVFSDVPVPTQASWTLSMRDRLAALKPLLLEARKELQKAKKIAA